MIAYCRNYLKQVLKGIGFADQVIFTRQDDASKYKGIVFSHITPGKEQLEKDGTRVAKEDDLAQNVRTYRYRLYKSTLPFYVTIVAQNLDRAEELRQNFIKALGTRFLDPDGNAITIEATETLTLEEESIQNPREGYEITVMFYGGIYRDLTRNLFSPKDNLEFETEIEKGG